MKLTEDFSLHLYFERIINLINEEYYEVTNFDKFIDDISYKIYYSNYKDFYTGYNWFINEKICLNIDREYINTENKIYNENIGCPIYIHFYNDPEDTYAYIELRNKSYIIIININIYKPINSKFKKDIKYYKYILKHEVTHIRTMYAYIDKNLLNSLKNAGDNITFDDIIQGGSTVNMIKNLMYCISPTELQAHINSYISFIKDEVKTIDLDNKSNMIEYLLINGYEYNILDKFNEIVDRIEFIHNYKLIFYIGYILNKYNLFHSNITKNKIIEILHKSTYTDEDTKLINDIINFINENFKKYKEKLYNVTYKVLSDNNL